MNTDNISSEKSTVIKKIQTWLDEENISIRDIEDEYSDFHIVAKISPVHDIDLVIRKDRIDSIIVVQNMNLSDEDKRTFAHLAKAKKLEFVRDLKLSLLHLGIDYAIQPDSERLEYVQMSRKIYFDGLTKDRFFDTIFHVQRAMEIMRLKYETHLYHGTSDKSYLNSLFIL